ncbi:hypothetical protein FH972_024505 [Carpinus fangiana]|uniref:Uncharacterized protein n=1 Tax=Carpinus fangiana TaxID=176857 RepID=A0A5N6KYI9_9ROSI|nr:hypothetical protein FH972_024505 [Carpinus fangiana]
MNSLTYIRSLLGDYHEAVYGKLRAAGSGSRRCRRRRHRPETEQTTNCSDFDAAHCGLRPARLHKPCCAILGLLETRDPNNPPCGPCGRSWEHKFPDSVGGSRNKSFSVPQEGLGTQVPISSHGVWERKFPGFNLRIWEHGIPAFSWRIWKHRFPAAPRRVRRGKCMVIIINIIPNQPKVPVRSMTLVYTCIYDTNERRSPFTPAAMQPHRPSSCPSSPWPPGTSAPSTPWHPRRPLSSHC